MARSSGKVPRSLCQITHDVYMRIIIIEVSLSTTEYFLLYIVIQTPDLPLIDNVIRSRQ